MAKFEERDPRWIVDERADGTNVNNWHWTEKDCTAWSKARLAELLADSILVQTNAASIRVTELREVTGDAFINNRKNKLFASFDFTLKIAYVGELTKAADNGVVKSHGLIEVPNLSDEQDPDDWEFRIVPDDGSSEGQKLKESIQRSGRDKLRSLISIYTEELKTGVPAKSDAATDIGAETPTTNEIKNAVSKTTPKSTQSTRHGFHNLHINETFHANPQDICDCFTVAGKIQVFTQSPAKVDASVGGEFSWFDGSISGRFLEIEAPTRLLFDWRFNSWAQGHYSKVEINIDNPEPGIAILNLQQTQIPDEDDYGNANVLAVTESGWRNQILTRIKAVFGYGI